MEKVRAAFFRVEGTLVTRPTLATAAWFASHSQGLGERFLRLSTVAASAPLRFGGELEAGVLGTRLSFMGARGMSEDRLRELGRDYRERYVEPKLTSVGLSLLESARKQGYRIVLLSDNLDVIMAGLAERLGADDLVCNALEIRDGRATGRLVDPVIGPSLAGQWARAFAASRDIDLEASCVYGASAADSLLMSAIGHPCAVSPDFRLRRIAQDHNWPVVEA